MIDLERIKRALKSITYWYELADILSSRKKEVLVTRTFGLVCHDRILNKRKLG